MGSAHVILRFDTAPDSLLLLDQIIETQMVNDFLKYPPQLSFIGPGKCSREPNNVNSMTMLSGSDASDFGFTRSAGADSLGQELRLGSSGDVLIEVM
jgi:hypothetical protein